jgi:hypothetical protein
MEKESPVEEKVVSSTPVIFAPSETGKLDDACWTLRSWRTTLLRSPWASAEPSSDVNFFCWKIDLRASVVGAHVPFDLERHRSLREARIETTRLRLSGFSGEATQ